MRAVAVLLWLAGFASMELFGQGQFVLNNRSLPDINAPFVLCTDPPGTSSVAGAAFQVQVYAAAEGTPPEQFTNTVIATTTFRSGLASGYVNPITVTVPNFGDGYVSVYLRDAGPMTTDRNGGAHSAFPPAAGSMNCSLTEAPRHGGSGSRVPWMIRVIPSRINASPKFSR